MGGWVEGELDSLDGEQPITAIGNSAKTAKPRSGAPPRSGALPGAWDDKPQVRIRKGRTVRTRGVHRVSAAPSRGTRGQGEMAPAPHQGMNQR